MISKNSFFLEKFEGFVILYQSPLYQKQRSYRSFNYDNYSNIGNASSFMIALFTSYLIAMHLQIFHFTGDTSSPSRRVQ
jgi:hypothetical protein